MSAGQWAIVWWGTQGGGCPDLQVKIHGQRLELGELESIIALHPAVGLALVRLVQPDLDHPEGDFLAAYLTLAEGRGRRPRDVRFAPARDGSVGRSATLWMLARQPLRLKVGLIELALYFPARHLKKPPGLREIKFQNRFRKKA